METESGGGESDSDDQSGGAPPRAAQLCFAKLSLIYNTFRYLKSALSGTNLVLNLGTCMVTRTCNDKLKH